MSLNNFEPIFLVVKTLPDTNILCLDVLSQLFGLAQCNEPIISRIMESLPVPSMSGIEVTNE